MSERPAPLEPAPRLPPAAAALLAWFALALVNAVFIARLPGAGSRLRLAHHLVDAGHLVFVGALVALGVAVWDRAAGKHPRRASAGGLAVLAALGIALAVVFLRDDFAGYASEAGRGGPFLLWAMQLVAGLSPAVLVLVTSRLARRGLVWALLLLVAGIGVGVANDLVLRADYRGVHLFAALDAAAVLAVALGHLPFPRRLQRLGRQRVLAIALAVVAAVSAPSVALQPSNAVRVELARIDGAVVVPLLARFGWGRRKSNVPVPPELALWFDDRRTMAAVRPSSPSVLPKDPIVILLGVDSMRADLFAREETRARMPRLTALQESSLDFTMARSPGARTITTWASVFSGKHGSGLRWEGDGNRLGIRLDPTPRFSEILGEAGVATSTFVSYSALGKTGLARNFGEVVDVPARKGQKFALSTEVVPRMVEHLKKPRGGPRFVFAHFMDPHFPYDAGGKRGSAFDTFMAEVELADTSFGVLWDALDAEKLLERTVLIVTADHGEAFGQHDTPYHTVTLYEELIRVPLFIRVPGVAARTIDVPVSLMDLGPTVLDMFSLPTPATFLGQSLVPFVRGETPTLTRPIGAERHGTRALVIGKHKVIVDKSRGRDEIYDLEADPQETNNLADALGPEGDRLIGLTSAFFDAHALPVP